MSTGPPGREKLKKIINENKQSKKNKIVGESTSGNYSFYYDKSMLFGYVTSNVDIDKNSDKFEIEIAKKRYKLNLIREPLHDPANKFVKI